MPPTFIGQPIEVTLAGEKVKRPASFCLGQSQYQIAEILAAWHDHGFGKVPRRHPRWWQRRHRNCYLVKTTEGQIYEIYYERGVRASHPERRRWYLYRQL